MLATDDGASMVGEIALVPAHNRLSELELTFFHGIFDENVSSHMALGNGLREPGSERLTAAERRAAGMSTSIVHHDFTIGGPEIDVSGVMKGPGRAAHDWWQLELAVVVRRHLKGQRGGAPSSYIPAP